MTKLKTLAKRAMVVGAAVLGPHRWSSRHPRLWVLMYHRVLPRHDHRAAAEEPGMIVSPETLRNHLRWLRELFDLVHLEEWVDNVQMNRPVPSKACAITFDDGWLDNYEFAFPILKDMRAPATIFVVSHMLGSTETFWPNRLARLLREPRSAQLGTTESNWLRELGRVEDRPLNSDEISRAVAAAKALSDAEILGRVSELERSLDIGSAGERSLLDWREVREMVDSGLVNIGSHTCHHTRLNQALPAEKIFFEVAESRHFIASQIGRSVRSFCYPNGDVTEQAAALVQEHYSAAVTTSNGVNSVTTRSHRLRRIGVHDDISRDRQAFLARISGWL